MSRLFRPAMLLLFASIALASLRPVLAAPVIVAPVVVASVAPVHSLLANVMAGVAEPVLLMQPGASPHEYVMRPSETAMLARADLVFWVGEAAEQVLLKPLSTVGRARQSRHQQRIVTLLEEPALHTLRARPTGAWVSPSQESSNDTSHHHHVDPHIWLDPRLAGQMVRGMVRELSRQDPSHAAIYQANGRTTLAKLDRLDAALRLKLAAVHARPYIVYHDAFQYFEVRYGLKGVGAVVASADVQPGVRLIRDLRHAIAAHGVKCIFTEPQYNQSLAATLAEGSSARVGVLDPLGMALKPGPDSYFVMMNNLANSLIFCLGAP